MKTVALQIDALGFLQAKIAGLELEARKLKDDIIAAGIGPHEGNLFRATVSVSTRETLDMTAVRGKLTPQFIAAHTSTSTSTCVRLVSKNASTAAA